MSNLSKSVKRKEINKAIKILRECQVKLQGVNEDALESWGLEGYCEQIEDEIYDLEQEIEDLEDEE